LSLTELKHGGADHGGMTTSQFKKVNFKIPSVARSKMRRSTPKEVLRTNKIFILKTKSASIIQLQKSFEKSFEIRQDSSQTKRDKRKPNLYNVQ